MIPAFPHFKPLELADKPYIDGFTRDFEPYSDFNFVSLYTWDSDHQAEWSILNNNLVVKFRDYQEDQKFYTLLGRDQIEDTIKAIIHESVSQGLPPILQLIPEEVIRQVDQAKSGIVYAQDDQNFDYILSIDDLISLTGNKFASKRHSINKFKRLYPEAECKLISLSDPAEQAAILKVFDVWAKNKNISNKLSTKKERIAIQKIFEFVQDANVLCYGVFVGRKLCCFTVCELLSSHQAIAHYQKADPSYYGIFAYALQEAARDLKKRGISLLNIEQSLGLNGLKQSKDLYRPVKTLSKYTVQLKC